MAEGIGSVKLLSGRLVSVAISFADVEGALDKPESPSFMAFPVISDPSFTTCLTARRSKLHFKKWQLIQTF